MIMRQGIPKIFKGTMSYEFTTTKGFLKEIEKWFAKNDKSVTNMLLASLISIRYKGKGNIREYFMEIFHISSKLKALQLELFEDLLVHLILISLPAQFNQFKVRYNRQKKKWILNELIWHYVQEEKMLKQEKTKKKCSLS